MKNFTENKHFSQNVVKKSRNFLSLETKYKIIQLIDSNTSYSEILKQFKSEVTANNISKIKTQRHRIITAFESSLSSKAKTLKTTSYPDIEKVLIDSLEKEVYYNRNTSLKQSKITDFCKRFE